MRIKKSVRYICLGLIFVMLCGSVFLGSRSFAKYLEEYKNQQEAGVATPIVNVQSRYSLTRKQGLEEYTHVFENDKDKNYIELKNIAPNDEISYYFGVSSNTIDATNEVLLQVEVSFIVSLHANKEYTVINKDTNAEETKITSIPKSFLIGENYINDGEDIDIRHKGSLAFFRNMNDELSSTLTDYTNTGFTTPIKTDTISYENDSISYSEITQKYNYYEVKDGKNVDAVLEETLYKHTVGFYLDAGVATTKGYLIKINLPSQAFDTDGYIGAMLRVDLDVNARQVQSKS